MSQYAVFGEQHSGVVRIVAHQCGWLGCRVGEAANPRAKWCAEIRFCNQGDSESNGELLDALERDLTLTVAPKRRARRVFDDDEEPARVADLSPRAPHSAKRSRSFIMRCTVACPHARIPKMKH